MKRNTNPPLLQNCPTERLLPEQMLIPLLDPAQPASCHSDPVERADLTAQDLAIATLVGRYERREAQEPPWARDLFAVAAEFCDTAVDTLRTVLARYEAMRAPKTSFDFFDADDNEQIATMTADGSDLREITSGTGIHELPSWSPNGRRIVVDYSPEADPNTPGFETRLWTMRADGSHARPLPMWQPGFDVEPKHSQTAAGSPSLACVRTRVRRRPGCRVHRRRQRRPRPAAHAVECLGSSAPMVADSNWIVFTTPEGTIEAIRPNDHGRHMSCPPPSFGGHKPWFSHDGSQILVMCAISGPTAITTRTSAS